MVQVAHKRLGDLLVDAGIISAEDLGQALDYQKKFGVRLGKALIDLRLLTERQLIEVLEFQLGIPHVDLSKTSIDNTLSETVPEALARRYSVIPVARRGNVLTVAMADPFNVVALDELRAATRLEVQLAIAAESELLQAIDRVYGIKGAAAKAIRDFGEVAGGDVAVLGAGAGVGVLSRAGAAAVGAQSMAGGRFGDQTAAAEMVRGRAGVEDAPIVRLVNLIITQAVRERASDIHIEPREGDVRVRFRVDGFLRDVMTSPKNTHQGLVSRIKVLAGMDIAERRLPQDGQMRANVDGREIDFRVSTLPTVNGEKAVLRVLLKEPQLIQLDSLGFSPRNKELFTEALRRPYGMVLVTGPTGSGKTTTLYAALTKLNEASRNIVTVEDPVEFTLRGINQVQTNVKAGLTFANALRSILRQDPDVIMVGEIRDADTARIAVQSALTGHLVLSTIHTNDATSTLTRLVDMGIEPFLVASSVICTTAQRLVRRVCPSCRVEYEAGLDALEGFAVPAEVRAKAEAQGGKVHLSRGKGCVRCGRTGFLGRVALTEVMMVTPAIKALVTHNETAGVVRRKAQEEGMRLLLDDGLEKALQGLTTLDEVVRVAMGEE